MDNQSINNNIITKKTILFCLEGFTDKEFVRYLKSRDLYDSNSYGISVSLYENGGGGAVQLVEYAIDKLDEDYDCLVVVIDGDRGKDTEDAIERVKGYDKIFVVRCDVCFEHILLKILNGNLPKSHGCGKYKSVFRKKYGKLNKNNAIAKYKSKLPKSLLDKKRTDISALDDIINYITIGC